MLFRRKMFTNKIKRELKGEKIAKVNRRNLTKEIRFNLATGDAFAEKKILYKK